MPSPAENCDDGNRLEQLVIDGIAARAGSDRWDLFTPLDDAFERIAAAGKHASRSRG